MRQFNFIKNNMATEGTDFIYSKLLEQKPRLNLGCNSDIRDTYINIDILDTIEGVDIVADVKNLLFIQKESVEEILAYDLLEHFPFSETTAILKNWISKLKKDGKIIVRVPDLEKISKKVVDGTLPIFEAQRLIYGGQDYEFNFHFAGFTSGMLEGLLLASGCTSIVQIVRENDSHNVTIVAKK